MSSLEYGTQIIVPSDYDENEKLIISCLKGYNSSKGKPEHLEDQSSRSNIGITGIAKDKDVDSLWDDTERSLSQ